MADDSVTTNATQEPPLTPNERRQFERLTGVLVQFNEILPMINGHAAEIISLLPCVQDQGASSMIGKAADLAMNIRYLSDLAILITSVESLRITGDSHYGSSLHEVYEQVIPWPVHADSKQDIEAAKATQ